MNQRVDPHGEAVAWWSRKVGRAVDPQKVRQVGPNPCSAECIDEGSLSLCMRPSGHGGAHRAFIHIEEGRLWELED